MMGMIIATMCCRYCPESDVRRPISAKSELGPRLPKRNRPSHASRRKPSESTGSLTVRECPHAWYESEAHGSVPLVPLRWPMWRYFLPCMELLRLRNALLREIKQLLERSIVCSSKDESQWCAHRKPNKHTCQTAPGALIMHSRVLTRQWDLRRRTVGYMRPRRLHSRPLALVCLIS